MFAELCCCCFLLYLLIYIFFIAMSFPASGVESAYRNNLKDVAKMLKSRHDENYMVRTQESQVMK